MRGKSHLLALGAAVSVAACNCAEAADFFGLDYLPGGSPPLRANGVSDDGTVVVGISGTTAGNQLRAFRWSAGTGTTTLGLLPGGDTSWGRDVSGDGSVVVGYVQGPSGPEVFRWTASDGMVSLGINGEANGVSADGSAVVGNGQYTSGSGGGAFRWTASDGAVGLGYLPGGNYPSEAFAASADGSVVVGVSDTATGKEAFRWTESGGMVGLGLLPVDSMNTRAYGVSADGSVVVGESWDTAGEGFMWTQAGGMVGLGKLPGDHSSTAWAVSGNGLVVVGSSFSYATGDAAVIWDQTNGIRLLSQVLVNDYGLDLTGWTLNYATDVSFDGQIIVGTGTYNGQTQSFVARLPEPASFALLAIGAPLLLRRRAD
ncbi:MAG: hypothetical protein R3C45_02515 [Phycisphaerales bacterium]